MMRNHMTVGAFKWIVKTLGRAARLAFLLWGACETRKEGRRDGRRPGASELPPCPRAGANYPPGRHTSLYAHMTC